MRGFLEYVDGNSPLHRMHPLSKLLFSFSICTCCFLSSQHLFLLALLLLDLALGCLAGIPKQTLRMLRGLVKLSLIIFLFQLLFVRSGQVLVTLPLGLVLTTGGIRQGLLVILRLCAATLPLALLLSVTQLTDLSNVLCGTLHIPYRYTFMLTTAIRFMPVFANEMADTMEAQRARGVELETRNPIRKLRLILPLCMPLLLSSIRKSDQNAVAAEMRGFALHTSKSACKRYPLRAVDSMAILPALLLPAAACLL